MITNLLFPGDVGMVKLLLDHGGDKSSLMGIPANITPCSLAADLDHVEILELLNAHSP